MPQWLPKFQHLVYLPEFSAVQTTDNSVGDSKPVKIGYYGFGSATIRIISKQHSCILHKLSWKHNDIPKKVQNIIN